MRTGRAAVGKGFGLDVVRSVCGVWDSDGTESCFSVLSADDAAVFYSVLMLLHPLLSFENLIGVFIKLLIPSHLRLLIMKLLENCQSKYWQKKKIKYNKLEKQLTAFLQLYNEAVQDIIKAFKDFEVIRKKYADSINENSELSKDGLDFSVVTPFRTEMFCNTLVGLYDKRSLKAQRDWLEIDAFDNKKFLTTENLQQLIDKTLGEKLRITKGKNAETVLREIFSDWFNTTYQVEMDGDPIGNMSPGKKALVLLKLLINLAENKCPFLIDQPEDDLDNRSIFDELIPFISQKKIDRQIIIVTHNANVVLGGDAEEVIVANQNGNNAKNKQYKFEYRTGSIEDDVPIESQADDVLSSRGIQQHICDILEGGEKAFDLRKNKYRIG